LQFAPAGTAEEVLDDDTLKDLMEEELGPERTQRLVEQINLRGLHNIVAILIHVRWDLDDLKSLEKHYAEPDPANPVPINLPFTLDTAVKLFGHACGEPFYDTQDIYLPFTIIQGQHNIFGRDLSSPRRLPIISTMKIAGGAGGDVFRAQIAKGGWQYPDGNKNKEKKWVAQKVFNRGSLEERVEMFEWEVRIYEIIQRTAQHNNLAECLGRLERTREDDNEYSIFLHPADYSLEALLTELEPHSKATVEFSKYASDMFAYAADLCNGVYSLHHSLLDRDGKPISVLHLDLKPQNILVYLGTSLTTVLWKIADYGLSRDKPRQQGLNTTNPLIVGIFTSVSRRLYYLS
jgi:protein kinase-like protein